MFAMLQIMKLVRMNSSFRDPKRFNFFKIIIGFQFMHGLKRRKTGLWLTCFLILIPNAAYGQTELISDKVQSSDPYDAPAKIADFTPSAPHLFGQLRLRYNTINDDGFQNKANELTLRALAGAEYSLSPETSILVEGEAVIPLIDEFNDGSSQRLDFPFIPDANGIELNRAQILTEIIPRSRITIGRQRIVYDDGRFIGDAPFRQNNQSFDAIRGRVTLFETGFIDGAYIRNARRILGSNSPAGRFQGDSYTANLNLLTPLGRLIGYHYSLDFNTTGTDIPNSLASNQTTGVMLSGRRHWDNKGLVWEFGYANQTDFADNPNDYEANYGIASLRGEIGPWQLRGKAEILGGSDVQGFQTPAASLRKFQGLADVFLQTPPDGIQDLSLQTGYKFGKLGPFKNIRASVSHHWFSSERGNIDYGTEIDATLQFTFKNILARLDYANYNADAFASDTEKLFVTLTRSF